MGCCWAVSASHPYCFAPSNASGGAAEAGLATAADTAGTALGATADCGAHRATVTLAARQNPAATPTLPLAVVELTWRRRDVQPQTKDILVAFRAANASGAAPLPIANRVVLSVNGSVGRILLDGSHGPGVYDVYYLPLVSNGAAFGRKDAFQPMRRNGSSSAVSPQAILP